MWGIEASLQDVADPVTSKVLCALHAGKGRAAVYCLVCCLSVEAALPCTLRGGRTMMAMSVRLLAS